MKSAKPSYTPEPEGAMPVLFCTAGSDLPVLFLNPFSLSISLVTSPSQCETSIVVWTRGVLFMTETYCPINHTQCSSKLRENVIKKQLENFWTSHNHFRPCKYSLLTSRSLTAYQSAFLNRATYSVGTQWLVRTRSIVFLTQLFDHN